MVFGALGVAGAAHAQQILAPQPSYPVTPPAVLADQSERTGFVGNIQDNLQVGVLDLLQWGPVILHPHFDYTVSYGTGIESAPGTQNSTLIQTFSPGVLFNLGSHWTIDYSPSFSFYSSGNLKSSTSHTAQLTGGASIDDWVFGLHQSYTTTSTPLAETGAQTSTETYGTEFNLSYRFNTSISTDFSADQTILDAPLQTGSRTWSVMDYLNYAIYQKFVVAIGGGAGYDNVTSGTDMSHETAQLRVSWRATQKLSIIVHGGAEDRQYVHGGVPPSITPTYGASVSWSPGMTTSITLGLDRSISPSLFLNQATDTTSLSLGLDQRLFKHLNLSLNGAYSNIKYLATSSSNANLGPSLPGRTDNFYSFGARLGWALLKRAAFSAYYQYGTDSSSANNFNYHSSQLGLEASYRL